MPKCAEGCQCFKHFTGAKTAAKLRGRPLTQSHREKVAEANRRRAATPEARARSAEQAKRLASDPQWRQHMAEQNRRLASDPEWLRKNREAIEKRLPPLNSPTKRCPRCKTVREKSQFQRDKGKRDGLQNICRECRSAETLRYKGRYELQAKAYRQANADKLLNANLQRMYGVTLSQYRAMLEAQGGVCAICGEPERRRGKNGKPVRLAVDHDHETRAVRGLLCNGCNLAIGHLRLKPELIERAVNYLCRAR